MDHEYFSFTYSCPPARPQEYSPNSSDSDQSETLKVTNENGNVIIDPEPKEVPCNSGYSMKSAIEDDEKLSESGSSLDVDSVAERKTTLRGFFSRSKHLHVLRRGNCTEIILANENDKNSLTLEVRGAPKGSNRNLFQLYIIILQAR